MPDDNGRNGPEWVERVLQRIEDHIIATKQELVENRRRWDEWLRLQEAHLADDRRRWEEDRRKWEENQRRWDENQRRLDGVLAVLVKVTGANPAA